MTISDIDGRPVIVGGGLAGMMTALYMAPQPVVLLSKARLGAETSSALAQGGIAASLGADDNTALHAQDTLRAGDGLNDPAIVEAIVEAAPRAIDDLVRFGVAFDRNADGQVALGLEAAHGCRRIVHAGGDGTGREIVRALSETIRTTPSVTILEGFSARRLVVEGGRLAGLVVQGPGGIAMLATRQIVLATGGIGGLFQHGTNPAGSTGQGLALAARAGAALADLEFIQFHPTALDAAGFPLKLISEAVRGEGAILIDETGRRFMAAEPGAELAPRDVVARAVWQRMADGHRVFLDARHARLDFSRRFPSITALCRAEGIDPSGEPIPIRPAAHYHMGGIKVDIAGRSTLPGLWACGEVACTGLHGANRLASNSLLEAVVGAKFVAESLASSAMPRRPLPAADSAGPCNAGDASAVRAVLTHAAGVLRGRAGLIDAAATLYPVAPSSDPALVGLMIVMAALRREESRGAHMRVDFPRHDDTHDWRRNLTLCEALDAARETIPELVA
jgi:L-aspartate oxidase